MKTVIAAIVALAFATPAFAQGGAVSKDKKVTAVPTAAECAAGWKESMPWKKADYDKACASVKPKK